MPTNKVNNNIKLKSGGGILNDATDGLSVEPSILPQVYEAAETITADSFLSFNSDGKLVKTRFSQAEYTATNALGSSTTFPHSSCWLNENLFVMAGINGGVGSIRLQAFTHNNGVYTDGTAIDGNSLVTTQYIKLLRIDDNKFAVINRYLTTNRDELYASLYSVSGTTITQVVAPTLVMNRTTTGDQKLNYDAVILDSTSFFVSSYLAGATYTEGRVVQISGSAFTLGTQSRVLQNTTTPSSVKLARLSSTKLLAVHCRGGGTTAHLANIITISGVNFTIEGSDTTIFTGGLAGTSNYFQNDLASISDSFAAYAYQDSGDGVARVRLLKISGSTITTVHTLTLASFLTDTNRLIIKGESNLLYLRCLTNVYKILINGEVLSLSRAGTFGTFSNDPSLYLNNYLQTNGQTSNRAKVAILNMVADEIIGRTSSELTIGNNYKIPTTLTGFSNLSPSTLYYIDDYGNAINWNNSVATTSPTLPIGRAINATTILK